MSRLTGWFRSAAKPEEPGLTDQQYIDKVNADITNSMDWAGMILNDDIDGAWEQLQHGDSSFHGLGLAVTFFMRSVLGFEKQIMLETSQRLVECDKKATADIKRAQKYGAARSGSSLYPPGTEYELVRAETQLMSAVVGVLNESLMEALKGFYNVRKAFYTLDGIISIEEKKLAAQMGGKLLSTDKLTTAAMPGSFGEDDAASSDSDVADKDGADTPLDKEPSTAATTPERTEDSRPASPIQPKSGQGIVTDALDISDNPVDIFIHSGANMCFGIIMLLLTIIPPSFSRILSVVGFQGDRARGVRLLWTSAAVPNVNGAVAALVLLNYYNGLMGFVDVLPADQDFDDGAETVGPPKAKCQRLLANMQARYPDSGLWRLDEARQLANQRRLREAIAVGQSGKESKMKQVTSLTNFELAMNSMYAHQWESMRDAFKECLATNNWSAGMYNYLVACAIIELYRDAVHNGKTAEAQTLKAQATEYLKQIHETSSKTKMRGRPLPFDRFVQRKLNKWEERAKSLGVDLVDAVGTSPALEMSFLWNGHKRMGPEELQSGLTYVQWERCTAPAEVVEKLKADKDEMAVWALSTSVLLSRSGDLIEARSMLQEHILSHNRSLFKGTNKDDYTPAAATYEMGVMAWLECCSPPTDLAGDELKAYRLQKATECQEQFEKVRAWETYLLDARIGLRVQSGMETLEWFRKKMA